MAASKRIAKEMKDLAKDAPSNCSAGPKSESDLFNWSVERTRRAERRPPEPSLRTTVRPRMGKSARLSLMPAPGGDGIFVSL